MSGGCASEWGPLPPFLFLVLRLYPVSIVSITCWLSSAVACSWDSAALQRESSEMRPEVVTVSRGKEHISLCKVKCLL